MMHVLVVEGHLPVFFQVSESESNLKAFDMASTSSENEQSEVVINPNGDQINPSEVIYYTERLKEYYERSDNDVMSTLSTGTKAKYLDQLKGQLQIGEDDQSSAVVPFDPDPMGLKPSLQHLGKEDLMNVIINMAKKWEEGGKPAEIKVLLDKVSGTFCTAIYNTLAFMKLSWLLSSR